MARCKPSSDLSYIFIKPVPRAVSVSGVGPCLIANIDLQLLWTGVGVGGGGALVYLINGNLICRNYWRDAGAIVRSYSIFPDHIFFCVFEILTVIFFR